MTARGRSARTFDAIAFSPGPYAKKTIFPVTPAESSAPPASAEPVITVAGPAAAPDDGCPCTSSTSWPACQIPGVRRSEEHTSELQSLAYLVCRLLLEKKKKKT